MVGCHLARASNQVVAVPSTQGGFAGALTRTGLTPKQKYNQHAHNMRQPTSGYQDDMHTVGIAVLPKTKVVQERLELKIAPGGQ